VRHISSSRKNQEPADDHGVAQHVRPGSCVCTSACSHHDEPQRQHTPLPSLYAVGSSLVRRRPNENVRPVRFKVNGARHGGAERHAAAVFCSHPPNRAQRSMANQMEKRRPARKVPGALRAPGGQSRRPAISSNRKQRLRAIANDRAADIRVGRAPSSSDVFGGDASGPSQFSQNEEGPTSLVVIIRRHRNCPAKTRRHPVLSQDASMDGTADHCSGISAISPIGVTRGRVVGDTPACRGQHAGVLRTSRSGPFVTSRNRDCGAISGAAPFFSGGSCAFSACFCWWSVQWCWQRAIGDSPSRFCRSLTFGSLAQAPWDSELLSCFLCVPTLDH
jgi:hypothetical protein